jgi:hypothetical protein
VGLLKYQRSKGNLSKYNMLNPIGCGVEYSLSALQRPPRRHRY